MPARMTQRQAALSLVLATVFMQGAPARAQTDPSLDCSVTLDKEVSSIVNKARLQTIGDIKGFVTLTKEEDGTITGLVSGFPHKDSRIKDQHAFIQEHFGDAALIPRGKSEKTFQVFQAYIEKGEESEDKPANSDATPSDPEKGEQLNPVPDQPTSPPIPEPKPSEIVTASPSPEQGPRFDLYEVNDCGDGKCVKHVFAIIQNSAEQIQTSISQEAKDNVISCLAMKSTNLVIANNASAIASLEETVKQQHAEIINSSTNTLIKSKTTTLYAAISVGTLIFLLFTYYIIADYMNHKKFSKLRSNNGNKLSEVKNEIIEKLTQIDFNFLKNTSSIQQESLNIIRDDVNRCIGNLKTDIERLSEKTTAEPAGVVSGVDNHLRPGTTPSAPAGSASSRFVEPNSTVGRRGESTAPLEQFSPLLERLEQITTQISRDISTPLLHNRKDLTSALEGVRADIAGLHQKVLAVETPITSAHETAEKISTRLANLPTIIDKSAERAQMALSSTESMARTDALNAAVAQITNTLSKQSLEQDVVELAIHSLATKTQSRLSDVERTLAGALVSHMEGWKLAINASLNAIATKDDPTHQYANVIFAAGKVHHVLDPSMTQTMNTVAEAFLQRDRQAFIDAWNGVEGGGEIILRLQFYINEMIAPLMLRQPPSALWTLRHAVDAWASILRAGALELDVLLHTPSSRQDGRVLTNELECRNGPGPVIKALSNAQPAVSALFWEWHAQIKLLSAPDKNLVIEPLWIGFDIYRGSWECGRKTEVSCVHDVAP